MQLIGFFIIIKKKKIRKFLFFCVELSSLNFIFKFLPKISINIFLKMFAKKYLYI